MNRIAQNKFITDQGKYYDIFGEIKKTSSLIRFIEYNYVNDIYSSFSL